MVKNSRKRSVNQDVRDLQRKNSRKEAKKGYSPGIAAFMKVSCQRDRSLKA